MNKKHEQFNEQEKTMSILQQDILCKQQHIESLDRMLIESRKVTLIILSKSKTSNDWLMVRDDKVGSSLLFVFGHRKNWGGQSLC